MPGQVIAQHIGRCDDLIAGGGDTQAGQLGGIGAAGFQRLVADKQGALARRPQCANRLDRARDGRITQVNGAVQVKDKAIHIFPFLICL